MRVAAVVPAAGSGTRFGSEASKIWSRVAGRSLLEWSVGALAAHPQVDSVVVVGRACDLDLIREACSAIAGVRDVVAGGATRAESVRCGLAAAPMDAEVILVHDAARPAVGTAMISRVIDAVCTYGAAVPGLSVSDTVKRVGEGMRIVETVPRDGLWAVQTPQGAMRPLLERAYSELGEAAALATDEAGLLEAVGVAVHLVEGDPLNRKVTVPSDLALVEATLGHGATDRRDRSTVECRTGLGYDVHRLVEGRALWLGGVQVEHTRGLEGHSDADVILHALCDALLGAVAAGDIGMLFPDTDEVNRGRSSVEFVREAAQRVAEAGYRVANLDLVVLAEEPRIGPHRDSMREAIARAVGVESDRVSIKATTSESMGFAGRREGIACWATATVMRY